LAQTHGLNPAELRLLSELGGILATAISETELLEALSEHINHLVPVDRAVLTRLGPRENVLLTIWEYGLSVESRKPGATVPIEGSLASEVFGSGNGLIESDAGEQFGLRFPHFKPALEAGIRSVIAVPLRSPEKIFGVLHLQSRTPNQFDGRHLNIAEAIGVHLGSTLVGMELREQLEHEVGEGEVLERIARSASAALSISEIGDAVAQDLGELLQFDRVGVGVLSDLDTTSFRVEYQYPQTGLFGKSFPLAGSATGLVAETRAPVVIGRSGPNFAISELPVTTSNLGDPSLSGVMYPLISNGVMVGSMIVGRTSEEEFTQAEVHLVERVAAYISGPIANAILRRHLAQDANHHRVLAEISRVAGAATSISEIGEALARAIPEILPFKFLSISRIDDEAGTYWSEYFFGTPDHPDFRIGEVRNIGGSMAGAVLKSRQAVVLDLTDREAIRQHANATPAADIGMTSTIGVPLISNGRVIGAVLFGEDEDATYGEADAIVAERVADQIAGAIGSLVLRRQLEQESMERQALADLGRVTSQAGDMQSIGEATSERLASLLGVEKVAITRVLGDGEFYRMTYMNWTSQIDRSTIFPLGKSFAGLTSRSGQTQKYGKKNREELLARLPVMSNAVALGFARAISAPLIADGAFIGNLMVGDSQDDEFSADQADLVTRVANQITGAIASIGLRDDLEKEADEREVLAEIGRVASESQSFGVLGRNIVPLLNRLVAAPRLELRVISSDHKSFSVVFIQEGEGPPKDQRGEIGQLDESGSALALLERAPVAVGPTTDARELSGVARARAQGFYAGVHAPLISNDEVVGFMVVDNTERRDYSLEEVELLGQISQQIAGPMASLVLREQLERESTERQALADIGRAAITSGTAEEMGERTFARLKDLVGIDRLAFGLVSSARQNFTYVYSNFDDAGDVGREILVEGTLSQQTIDSGEALAFGKSNRDQLLTEFPAMVGLLKWGLMRGVLLPLIANDQVIGTMLTGDDIDDDYTPSNIEFLSSVADQVSGAINNIALRDELERESRQQLALAEISRAASSSLDISEIMERITQLLPGLLPFDRLQLTSVDLSAETVTVEINKFGPLISQSAIGRPNPLQDAVSGIAASTGSFQVINASNRNEIASRTPMLKASLEKGLKSLVSAPLISDGVVIGTLNISSDGPFEYSEVHGELLQRVADQLGGVFAVALRYRIEQREADIQELLTRVSTAASSALDPRVLLDQIEIELRTEFEYDRFEALIADSDEETLRFACVRGVTIGPIKEGDIVSASVQMLGDWGTILERSAGDSLKHEHILDSGLNSWMQVPIGFPSSPPIGFIGLRNRKIGAFTESDVETLTRIAVQITPAIQNARTYQQSLELAASRDRSIELESQARELQRIDEEKNRFLETVTHELKTPLTSIQAFTHLLLRNREGNLTDRQIRNLEVSSRNARRLGLLIDDLVDVSQIQTGAFELRESEFDLVDLTNELVESMQPIFGEKDQKLSYRLTPSTIWLRADRARVAQVVTNLLSNASKYSPNGSAIQFCVDIDRDNVHLEVEDDGFGISKSDLAHLFTPLFRADNEETRAVPGTGIGLAIVKKIVDLHGGDISVSSEVGVGTKFKIILPRHVTKPTAEYLAEQKNADSTARPRSRLGDTLSG